VDDAGGAGHGPGRGVQPRDRITTRYLTKYERARVLGTRALQIRCGATMGAAGAHGRGGWGGGRRAGREQRGGGRGGQQPAPPRAPIRAPAAAPAAHRSMNAPIMVDAGDETDPLEVRSSRGSGAKQEGPVR
jgi:hypothetical protein